MTKPTFDVIIVGLGAMGSATTYQLAKSGATVLGIDRYEPPHAFGSTHGDTRLTRRATGEGPEYIPLVTRSLELWREIEQATGYELLTQCGGLLMGVPVSGRGDLATRTAKLATQFGIAHESLSIAQIQARFPQFNLVGTEKGYYEPEAGFLRPEKCVQAQIELAKKHGAMIYTSEEVLGFEAKDGLITVKTDKASYQAKKLIISAGSWVGELLPDLSDLFKIYRQVLYWFGLKDSSQYEAYHQLPVFGWRFSDSNKGFVYGFPANDGPNGGLKIATEEYDIPTTPEQINRQVSQAEIDQMYERIRDRLPGLSSHCVKTTTCLYTETPDHNFVIDYHSKHENIIVASPCSGHGFKHSAAIGEVLAQLATRGTSDIDISTFSLGRFEA